MLDTPRIKVEKPRRAHPDKALTAVHVRDIKKPGKYCDGNGRYLVIDDSGAQRWLVRTVILGKRCDIGLGSVRLVSLAEAREEAVRIRRKARDGEDPLAERRRAATVTLTFKEAATPVHKTHAATFKNAKHRAQWFASLEADVFPTLGPLRVSAIQSGDVLKVLSPIWTTKPETATIPSPIACHPMHSCSRRLVGRARDWVSREECSDCTGHRLWALKVQQVTDAFDLAALEGGNRRPKQIVDLDPERLGVAAEH